MVTGTPEMTPLCTENHFYWQHLHSVLSDLFQTK